MTGESARKIAKTASITRKAKTIPIEGIFNENIRNKNLKIFFSMEFYARKPASILKMQEKSVVT